MFSNNFISDCGELEKKVNANYSLSGSLSDTEHTVGTTANYYCKDGYNILPEGNDKLVCSEDGSWQGELGDCYSGLE